MPRLSVRNVHFRTPQGVLALAPAEYGALRNDGNATALIDAMELTGVARDDYNLKIDYRGRVIAIEEVTARGPLLLEPGESIIVGGAFYAQPARPRKKRPANAGANRPVTPAQNVLRLHLATLHCRTNQYNYGVVDIIATAEIVAADARSTVLPQHLNFGVFELYRDAQQQQPRQRAFIITSDGTTSLFLSAITIVPPSPAFTYRFADAPPAAGAAAPGAIFQLDPGTSLVIYVYFNPTTVGVQTSRMVIETNAGRVEITMRGEGVRPF